jgi:hypothetical protein
MADDVNIFDCLILGFLENGRIKTEPDYTFYEDLRDAVLNLMKRLVAGFPQWWPGFASGKHVAAVPSGPNQTPLPTIPIKITDENLFSQSGFPYVYCDSDNRHFS